MNLLRKARLATSVVTISFMLSLPIIGLAQTRIKAPSNPVKIQQDVELGRQAAAEVERQLPVLRDRYVESYVDSIGGRLAESIPREFQHREFRYSFKVVDARDINAFALPGGFTYINRGLIEAAETEGQLAGVVAHEISHVALRHGTAQAAKAQKYQTAGIAGQILGAIIGGPIGSVVAAGSQFGVGAYFLKFSREYERQADTLGAQIMANAGYDPRELAEMFRIIERESQGRGGPEWLSSHPNPGNRYEAINREAEMLNVTRSAGDTGEFRRVQARLRDMPGARSMEEISRTSNRRPRGSAPRSMPGEPPSRSLETFRATSGAYQIGYPSNWQAFSQDNLNAIFAPDWAIENNEVTRGAMVNYYQGRRDYRGRNSANQALDDVLSEVLRTNTNLREDRSGRYSGRLSGQPAMATFLTGRNSLGEYERIWVIARPVGDGAMAVIFIAPEQEFRQYQPTFETMIRSITVNDRAFR